MAELTFLVLNFSFNIFNGVRRFNLQSNCLARQCLYKDLHLSQQSKCYWIVEYRQIQFC